MICFLFVIDVDDDDDGCWWLGSVLIDNDDNDLNYCWRRWYIVACDSLCFFNDDAADRLY